MYLLYKECIVHVRSDRKLWSICTGHYHCHCCCVGRRLAVVNVIVSWLKKPTCLFPSTFVRMLNTLFVSPRLIIPAARERCRRRKIVLSSKITTVNFFLGLKCKFDLALFCTLLRKSYRCFVPIYFCCLFFFMDISKVGVSISLKSQYKCLFMFSGKSIALFKPRNDKVCVL